MLRVEGPLQRRADLTPKRSSRDLHQLRNALIGFVVVLTFLTGATTLVERSAGSAVVPPRAVVTRRRPAPADPARARLDRLTPKQRRLFVRWVRLAALQKYLDAVWHATYDIPVALLPVAGCVKGAESGNYTEASHTSSGSGAYQFVPGTWRTWFARWAAATGYRGPDYAYAYLAPWFVQDAVFCYTVTHGGAGNWSNRYGYDPCTRGM